MEMKMLGLGRRKEKKEVRRCSKEVLLRANSTEDKGALEEEKEEEIKNRKIGKYKITLTI